MIEQLKEWKDWQLALLSGILLGLSFPPLKLGFLAWFGLVPLLRALLLARPWRGALLSFLSGLVMNALALHWLVFNVGAPLNVTSASLVAASLYLAIFWGLFGSVFVFSHSRTGAGLLLMPGLLVGMEFLMSLGPMGFPWVSLATTQTDYLPVIQLVEWTGTVGISFWLVTVNILLYDLFILPRAHRPYLLSEAFFFVVCIWLVGYVRLITLKNDDYDKAISISIVQPNVGPHEKWDPKNKDRIFAQLDSLYMLASKSGPNLIIWPEAATPAFLTKDYRRLAQVRQRIRQTGIPLLTGTVDWKITENRKNYYNSVAMISEDGDIPIYHKNQLVPMGEFNPFVRQLPLSEELNLGHYSRGREMTVFKLGDSSFASIICFESVFPRLVRQLTREGAQFLVVVVNDGWYGKSAELYQHKAIARLRAIEHRYPVVRSANTGISTVIDKAGREVASLGIGETGVITASIVPSEGETFYHRWGDWLVLVSMLSLALFGVRKWKAANS
ncbi:MAG: apolipoprotein N-acyltransferase [Candidatus Neomarinimicrobiota bacterium]|nr:apolipoprotein N-acyltransferase [Candidatus Neomarinimicrobiota bacterium]